MKEINQNDRFGVPLASKDNKCAGFCSRNNHKKLQEYCKKYTLQELEDRKKWQDQAEEEFKMEQIINHKI